MKVFRAKEVKGGEAALDFGQFNPNPHLTARGQDMGDTLRTRHG